MKFVPMFGRIVADLAFDGDSRHLPASLRTSKDGGFGIPNNFHVRCLPCAYLLICALVLPTTGPQRSLGQDATTLASLRASSVRALEMQDPESPRALHFGVARCF